MQTEASSPNEVVEKSLFIETNGTEPMVLESNCFGGNMTERNRLRTFGLLVLYKNEIQTADLGVFVELRERSRDTNSARSAK
jgi:hypothetical protein